MITSTTELDAVCAAMDREAGKAVAKLLSHALAHVEAEQAVAADWTGMQYWHTSAGTQLVVNRRDASGFGFQTVVGELFGPDFERRATSRDANHN